MMSSKTAPSMAAIEGSIGSAGGPAGGKAISRLIQHSILQLCNEHVQYSHKLQILGVLCMTVDDEQHELVVKVNNTLKRVGPQPQKDSQNVQVAPPSGSHNVHMPELQRAPEAVALYNGGTNTSVSSATGAFSVPNPLVASGPGYTTETVNEGEGSTTPISPDATPTSTPALTPSPVENGRKSHGRKRSKPMRVDHVYDEGDTIEEADGDILTVIPTDPDNPENVPAVRSVYLEDPTDDEDELMEEDDEDSLPPPKVQSQRRVASQKAAKSTASPSVRALLQQSIARKGSSSDATTTSASSQVQLQHSQLRSALLNGPAQSSSCLTLPICVAPNERSSPGLTNGDVHDEHERESTPGALHIDEDPQQHHDDSGVSVKEEPRDEYDWSRAGQVTEAISGAQASLGAAPFYAIANPSGIEGVSSLPTYSGLSLALTTANLQIPVTSSTHQEGLTIRYTPTGPITVGANGKNVSQQSSPRSTPKVKDIIMYDDQTPLNQQKGARLETDFMVDKMGIEGRKRRRRAPDETLTMEEIAEYMGATNGMDGNIGQGTFQCKYCPIEVGELVTYLQHTLQTHNAYICHQCGKSFTTKSSLLRHRPIHTGMRRFSCQICKKTFYRKDKCKAHIKRHLVTDGNAAEVSTVVE